MRYGKIINSKYFLAIASSVLIGGLGITFLAWSSPGTTTIGENITVAGDLIAKTGRTASLVVAASDSSAKSRAQADYVADGTADQVEIQAAIDALPAVGGTIVLSNGTFYISDTILLTKPVKLLGQGAGSTKLLKMADLPVIKVHSSYAGLQGIEIDGQRLSFPNSDNLIIGQGYWASWFRLTDLDIHDAGGNGILVDASQASAYFGLSQGIKLYRNGTGLKLTGSANASTYNQIDLFGNLDWGINLDSGSSNTFTGLTFQGSNQKAMLVHSGDANSIFGLYAEHSSPALQIDSGAHHTTAVFSYTTGDVIDNSDSSILINAKKINGKPASGINFGQYYYYDRGSLKARYFNVDTWGQFKGDGVNYHPWSIYASEGTAQSPSWVEVFRFLYGGAMSWNQALGLQFAKVTQDKTLSYESPDMVNYVDASSGPKIQTLPLTALAKGRVYVTKKIDHSANSVVIQPKPGETIEEQPNLTLTVFGQAVWYQSDGATWWLLK